MENKKSILAGIFFAVMAGFCWGTTGIARALGPETATSLGVVGVRVSVAMVWLVAISLICGDFKKAGPISKWPWPEMVAAGFCLGLFTYVYLESMKMAGVSLGAPISCASIPIFALLMEVMLLRVKPSGGQMIGLITCGVGGVMVSLFTSGGTELKEFNAVIITGSLLALLSGLIFSGYSLAIQRAVRRGCPYNVAICGMFIVASVIWLPYALTTQDMSWIQSPRGWMMGLYIGTFSAALGYFCYVRGISKVPVSIAVSLGMAEPLTGTLLGVLLLGEALNAPTWAGMVILFIGIYVIGQATVNKNKREQGQTLSVPA
ncbi:MAG: EamA family transporter [Candidatus Adiutrix sp.]|jgi:DME family drug/metabolite transporter|nr:EamA family transporter [Candidatus Adiutrix sp.]